MRKIWNEVKDWMTVIGVVLQILSSYIFGLTFSIVGMICCNIATCVKDILYTVKYFNMAWAALIYVSFRYDKNPITVADKILFYTSHYDREERLRHIAGMFKNKPQETGQQPENVVDFPIDEVTGKRIIGFKGN